MALPSIYCPVCHAIVGRDPDGTLHEHGEYIKTPDGRRFVPCILSGKRPVLEPEEREK